MIVGIGSTGCSGAERDNVMVTPICDGNSGLRFGARVPIGNVAPETRVRLELGYKFLFVDSRCQYWVLLPPNEGQHNKWEPTRTGVLTDDDAGKLSAAVSYGKWPMLAGEWGVSTISDVGSVIFHDTQVHVSCALPCDRAQPGLDENGRRSFEAVKSMSRALDPWLERLYRKSQPADGPLRVNVIRQNDHTFPLAAPADWPAKEPIERFINPTPVGELRPGNSFLMTDASDVAALRGLRERLIRGDFSVYENIPIKREGSTFPDLLSFRDVTAVEGADGLIPIP